MTSASLNTPKGLPQSGAAFIRFALDVIDLLKNAEPLGLDKDGFLQEYFRGNPPRDQSTREAWWNELRRAARYSCQHFDKGEVGWAWIRARPGAVRGQFFYHVEAEVEGSRIQIRAHPASLARLEPYTTGRWLTQTKSRQRVRAAEGLALIRAGDDKNDPRLA